MFDKISQEDGIYPLKIQIIFNGLDVLDIYFSPSESSDNQYWIWNFAQSLIY